MFAFMSAISSPNSGGKVYPAVSGMFRVVAPAFVTSSRIWYRNSRFHLDDKVKPIIQQSYASFVKRMTNQHDLKLSYYFAHKNRPDKIYYSNTNSANLSLTGPQNSGSHKLPPFSDFFIGFGGVNSLHRVWRWNLNTTKNRRRGWTARERGRTPGIRGEQRDGHLKKKQYLSGLAVAAAAQLLAWRRWWPPEIDTLHRHERRRSSRLQDGLGTEGSISMGPSPDKKTGGMEEEKKNCNEIRSHDLERAGQKLNVGLSYILRQDIRHTFLSIVH